MLIDYLPENITANTAMFLSALALGLLFGFAAQRSRFCLRTAVINPSTGARTLWLVALAWAAAGMAIIYFFDFADLSTHFLFSENVPLLGLVTGGILFGIGMIMARGCASRLTILTATGNLRALTVLFCFSIVGYSTIRGVLSQARAYLNDVMVVLPSLDTPEAVWLGYGFLLLLPLYSIARTGISISRFIFAAIIGLTIPATWVLTSTVLADPFEPVAIQAASFTRPWMDSLFYIMVSSALELSFGPGWIAGVLLGALAAATAFGELQWQGFSSPSQMLRYMGGGALMGFGAATAGGCTIGAGLAGIPALSVHGFIVLLSIIAGAKLAYWFIQADGVVGPQPNRQPQLPAE